jgi:hypothetical protein
MGREEEKSRRKISRVCKMLTSHARLECSLSILPLGIIYARQHRPLSKLVAINSLSCLGELLVSLSTKTWFNWITDYITFISSILAFNALVTSAALFQDSTGWPLVVPLPSCLPVRLWSVAISGKALRASLTGIYFRAAAVTLWSRAASTAPARRTSPTSPADVLAGLGPSILSRQRIAAVLLLLAQSGGE